MSSQPKAFVLCVSGPSGSGKTSLCDKLANELQYARRSISVTTRPQRSREISGQDYIFVSRSQFEEMKKRNDFLETAEVFGNCYGTPRQPVEESLKAGDIIVMDIDTVGAMNVKKSLGERCVTVFVKPPSMEELKRRLEERKQNDSKDLQKRLQEAEREIREADSYEYVIVNQDFDQAYAELLKIVEARRAEST